jgi:hypothetical protein
MPKHIKPKLEPATTNIRVRLTSRDRLNKLKRRWKVKSQSDAIDKAYDREMCLEALEPWWEDVR